MQNKDKSILNKKAFTLVELISCYNDLSYTCYYLIYINAMICKVSSRESESEWSYDY